ncbi:MAG: CBS domain-containing protein [Acidobacteriota bacterium]|nr:MAG: CBS domain-containing protein [Acidobacteriota bacterium]
MGEQNIDKDTDARELGAFMKHLLKDVHALEMLLDRGMIESEIHRIGAEQELFLVNRSWYPAPAATEILSELDPHAFTTELARFNLEFNLDPLLFGDDCLSRLEDQLVGHLEELRRVVQEHDCEVALTGILPTISKSDLGMENMTPRPRYYALNDAMTRLRGGAYEFQIRGIDELRVEHDNVMLEACNTSFQLHFQVSPEDFAELYNVAQLISAPLLAGATNSPLLFGRKLWKETRIAVFQQAVDTRRATPYLRESKGRVSFGTCWVKNSILEIVKEDIARYRLILGTEIDEDPFEAINQGRPPELKALCLHNGTIYRWNRPCYGISNGKAHLRIENRVLPSGPTPVDSIANAAFFFGLLSGFSSEYGNPAELIDFEDVRNNFFAAARLGLGAQFTWLDGKTVPAQELICDQLIPLARKGLRSRGIAKADISRYLDILEERIRLQKTGSDWMLRSLAEMRNRGSAAERLAAVTAAIVKRQKTSRPVHEWELATIEESGGWKPSYRRVSQFMRTDLVTVTENDTLELVANLMDWERIRHIPVEDTHHHLVGLISYRSLLRHYGTCSANDSDEPVRVVEIMKKDPITITPETRTVEAIALMREKKVGCLPVVDGTRLVGIVTERDFMDIAGDLLEKGLRNLRESEDESPLT